MRLRVSIFFVAVFVSAVWASGYRTPIRVNAQNSLKPDQTIRIVPILGTCVDRASRWRPGFTYTLTRAIRIQMLPDLSSITYDYLQRNAVDIGLNDFLIIEARAVAHKGDVPRLKEILRIVRPHSIYPPEGILDFPNWINKDGQPTYVAFSIKPEEQSFTLHYCSFRSPTTVSIDFSHAEVRKGNFSVNQGLILQ